MRRFAVSEAGTVTVLFVVLLPVLLFAGAVAIDIGKINSQKRYVQAQADLGAVAAARHAYSAAVLREAARDTVMNNPKYPIRGFDEERDVVLGVVNAGQFTPLPDQSDVSSMTAVKVRVSSQANLIALRMFMSDDNLSITRAAVASVTQSRVSFALSNCLLNLRLLDPVLRPILGTDVDVLCAGRGVDTRVDVLGFLTALSTEAALLTPSGTAMHYGDVLDASLPTDVIFETLLGRPVAVPRDYVRLADILYLAPDLSALQVGTPVEAISVDMSDILFALAEVLAERVIDLDLSLDLGGLAGLNASLRVADPRKIVIGAVPGDPDAVARTSQIELDLADINISGLFALHLRIGIANAEATLSAQGDACAAAPHAEIAVFAPVDVSLLDIDLGIRVLGLPAQYREAGIAVETRTQREMRRVSFTRQEYEDTPIKVLTPGGYTRDDDLVSSLQTGLGGLLSDAQAQIRVEREACHGLLSCLIGGTFGLLNSIMNRLTGTIVNVLNALGAEGRLTNAILEDLVGLGIARAELELLDVSCGGRPMLGAGGSPSVMRAFQN